MEVKREGRRKKEEEEVIRQSGNKG